MVNAVVISMTKSQCLIGLGSFLEVEEKADVSECYAADLFLQKQHELS